MSRPFLRARAAARLSVAVALALSATALSAATDPLRGDQVKAVNLDSVVVIGARPVLPLTFETDPRQPRQPMPASDGADYLKTIPGFSAIRNGGANADPVLRGMFGSRLNLLTNEGAMPGACPSRMDNPLSYVSPDTFDKLIVIKGPQTVLWGPGASAGTVRFSRDHEIFEEPTFKGSGSLLFGSAGRNDQVADMTWGAPLGYARVSANRSDSDDYRDGNGNVVPSRWTKWNTDVAAAWTPDADTLLEASLGRGNGQARYAGRGMDGVQFLRDSQALRFEKKNLPGIFDKLEANVYRNSANHLMDNYTLRMPNPMGSMPMPMASNVERLTTGGRVALSLSGSRLGATFGFDAQDSRHRSRNGTDINPYSAKPWQRDAVLRDIGAFGEATWRFDEQARMVAGARIDRASARDERLTTGMMNKPNPGAGQTRNETLDAGFVRYEHGSNHQGLSWYAGVGATERMPDYWELFSANTGPVGTPNAFTGVRTEKTVQLDAGLQYQSRNVDAWLSGYAGHINDFILFDYLPGGMMGNTTRARNVDANTHGAEAGMTWKPNMHWRIESSLAWAWGENASQHQPLPQMSPLEARLGVEWDGHQRWSAGALLRGVMHQPRVSPNEGNVVGRDLAPTAGFGTFAAHAAYRINDVLQLTAGVDNLFNRYYTEHLNLAGSADFGYPADPVRIAEPGRTLWLRLGVKY
jgi:iron complex outermembrane receptor protein